MIERLHFLALAALLLLAVPSALHAATLPNDVRLKPLKDLDGYFPFTPPATRAQWEQRADYVRRQILVSQGLWPMPTRTPLHAVLHGKIDRGEYTVEKVYFESAPGFFVTGNLYRPKNAKGKVPAVLFAHGHWQDARLTETPPAELRGEIATGQERFEQGGRSRFQSMCVQLARMGCVVWQWDMLSDSDAVQFPRTLIHLFAKQRPEMNTLENWGLFSPQAEAHLQSVMGLQTWNSIRSLDFVLSLPEVDSERIAITGASGGGTQTMLLAAVDPRVKLSFPAVMVSTAMQGGCTCESSSLLRVDTGNIEFASLFAPKPQGMTNANDWTKEMSTKGFPDIKKLYALMGAPDNVMLQRGEQFPHNYNAVSRCAFYSWLNKHFHLGQQEPVIERDYEPLSRGQLTVWDAEHPAPKKDDPNFERSLLKWFTEDASRQLHASTDSPAHLHEVVGKATEVLIGRTLATTGDVTWEQTAQHDKGDHAELVGLARNTTHGEELPALILRPKKVNGRAVIWLDGVGKSALHQGDGSLRPAVQKLLKAGVTVVGADLLYQGEFVSEPLAKTRLVANPREFAGYTFGYNHALFAQRTHDVLSLVKLLHAPGVGGASGFSSVEVAGFGGTGPIAAAARAVSGEAITHAAVDTEGFRFGKLLDYRDPMFLPGGAKYLDLPGFLALNAPQPLWLAGEGKEPAVVSGLYRAAGHSAQLTAFSGDAGQKENAAVEWLLK